MLRMPTPVKVILLAVLSCAIQTTEVASEPPPVFVLAWGGPPSSNLGSLDVPISVDVAPDGSVCVLESGNHRIQLFTPNGEYLTHWPAEGRDLEVAPTGEIYVADTDHNRVQKFSPDGVLLIEWGSLGSENGQFDRPFAIATYSDGLVYVADTGNDRIQKFDSSGQFILTWGKAGSGDGEFGSIQGLAIDNFGNLFAADAHNKVVHKFDLTGSYKGRIGSDGGANPADGNFYRPETIDVDFSGNLYVLDRWSYRIQKFDSNGVFLCKWGTKGSGDGEFCNPTGIALSQDGSVVYVTDFCWFAETDQPLYRYLDRVEKFVFSATPVLQSTWGSLKIRYKP